MTAHGLAIALDPGEIPAALRERAQWVCWKYINRAGKQTKCPVMPDGRAADSTDPATWSSYSDALAGWQAESDFAGIGFVFSVDDPFTGIDLDGCIDEHGALATSAQEIVRSLDSYAEISPSGRGVKVFLVGRKPEGLGCRSKAIAGFKETEIYSEKRFFTVTGRRLPASPPTIKDRQAALDSFCARLWPKKRRVRAEDASIAPAAIADDDELIQRAGEARNGSRFKALWQGDTSLHAGDHSAADQALCNMLAFWTAKDISRMDRLFRRSGLFREKWDERRGERTYGQMTIERAVADCTEVHTPRNRDASASGLDETSEDEGDLPEEEDPPVPLGERDPASGRLVLSPRKTLPTAEAFIREFNLHPQGRTLHAYGGLLMEWRDNRYCQVEEELVRQRLQPWLHGALRYVVNKRTHEPELVDFESNPTTVNQALETIRSHVCVPASTVSPSWLVDCGGPSPLEILPCRTLSVHIPSGKIIAPTPALFTINALDFDYAPDADAPERWIKFLEQIFGDDLQSVELLQEWFGYCLVSGTSQQKMLLLVGPRRSGKGTIARILTRLVGASNVAGPTTSSLAGNFGLQPLIEKSLAIVSDARFSGEHVGTVVERLLCISGEDTLTVDRKFLNSVSMKLPTRFMFLTNELPRLNDSSTALAGRFLVLRLTKSFYGIEDVTLTDQLLGELPGILLWAIEGWKRLKARGRFVQPESAECAIRDLEDLASPVCAFVRERCVVGAGHRTSIEILYSAWKSWCEHDGRTSVTNKQTFGRDLAAAVPGINRRRSTGMQSFYEGIGLAEVGE